MRRIILLITCLVVAVAGFSQSKNLQRARAYFEATEFEKSVEFYELEFLRLQSPKDFEQYALASLKLDELDDALMISQKGLKKRFDEDLAFTYLELLKQSGSYSKARKLATNWKGRINNQSAIERVIAACDSAMHWKGIPTHVRVRNLEHLNSVYDEVAPVFWHDSIVFASNREHIVIKKKSPRDGLPFFDLLISAQGENDSPVKFSSLINSTRHEGSCTFSKKGDTIVFARSGSDSLSKGTRLKLYSAQFVNGKWKEPQQFIFNDSLVSYGHPCFGADDQLFFFVSNMPGGLGGTDIYVCFNVNGYWSDPVNMGPNINTSGDELYPFMGEDGALYFSSNGHVSMGGFDIFVSHQYLGDFQSARNMGVPYSSSKDDFSYTEGNDGKVLISSNRKGTLGKNDLFLIAR